VAGQIRGWLRGRDESKIKVVKNGLDAEDEADAEEFEDYPDEEWAPVFVEDEEEEAEEDGTPQETQGNGGRIEAENPNTPAPKEAVAFKSMGENKGGKDGQTVPEAGTGEAAAGEEHGAIPGGARGGARGGALRDGGKTEEVGGEGGKAAEVGEVGAAERVRSKFVMESDPVKQQEHLGNAYDDVMANQRGVTIPDEALNRYKAVSPVKKLIAAIKDYYDNALKGQKVNVVANGNTVEVSFENDGKKKSVGWRMDSEKAATFEHLIPLLEKSTYAYSEENRDKRERGDAPQFHYFVNNANIDGVDIPIKIHVRELNLPTGTENRYYTHGLIKSGNVSPVNGNTPKGSDAGGGHAKNVPTDNKIQQSGEKKQGKR
jgi:hypothetical protein